MPIVVKNAKEIERMRRAGQVVASVHARLAQAIRPGVTTAELDQLASDVITAAGAKSSFLGYNGYPAHICTSVNDEVVHGIPGPRKLQNGDIISVDVGAILDGYHGDSAWTYAVGAVAPAAARLLIDTESALWAGIDAARQGNRLGAIGHAIETVARDLGYGIVEGYGGHGIGRRMHEEPHVPNVGDPGHGMILRPGLALAIEPMLTLGTDQTRELADHWTVVTADGSLAAHFEHTIAVMNDAALVLTAWDESVVE